jgi:uncharacterized membrane protein
LRRACLILLAAAFVVTLLPGPWGDERISDLFVYRTDAAAFLHGSLPYRDMGFEYPPLAAPLMALPGLLGTGEDGYRLAFFVLALGLAAGVVLLTGALAARSGGDRRTALLAAALMPLLTGAMIRTHFDLAPVALTLGALLAICARRPRLGFALLGAGVMTKGFPLVVAPVALAWLVARGERRAALAGAAALVLCTGAIAVAAVAVSPSGALDAVTYHLDRPVQLESSPASVLLALDAVGAGTTRSVHSHRSDGLVHPLDGAITALSAALLIGVLALCALAAARARPDGPPSERSLILASLTAVVAFAALGKVLSPQFLIWVCPLAALALSWRMWPLAGACAVAICLTLVEFPAHYFDVVDRESPWLWLVAARNAVLLAAVVLGLRALNESRARAAGSARWQWLFRQERRRPAPR